MQYKREGDLVFAVIADVIHAHENGQKLPVLLEVQTLNRETTEGSKQNRFRGTFPL